MEWKHIVNGSIVSGEWVIFTEDHKVSRTTVGQTPIGKVVSTENGGQSAWVQIGGVGQGESFTTLDCTIRVKCKYCGRWGYSRSECQKCGANID